MKFCGFEIRRDGRGNGYHLSQQDYVTEVLKRWEVTSKAQYPNYKVLEEDENYEGTVQEADVKEAQAMTGALLWLSTRTRPELACGVAAMSRLATRNPRRSIEIGEVLLAYLNDGARGLHYEATCSEEESWGKRQQLKVKRRNHLVEVFSDISYSGGRGHRSVQGLAIYLGGSIISWNCSLQAFPTHSTAESELVAYCECLTAGQSTVAMVASMWACSPKDIEKVMYGDNAAAVNVANGGASGTWRTRHLRVRSSVLRDALNPNSQIPEGPWRLMHLKGAELVADGFTKPLYGQAFLVFLADLGFGDPVQEVSGDSGVRVAKPPALALVALMASLLIAKATAQPDQEEEGEDVGDWWFVGGGVLMLLGCIHVAQWLWAAMMATMTSSGEEPVPVAANDDQPEEETCIVVESDDESTGEIVSVAASRVDTTSSGMSKRSGDQHCSAASASDAGMGSDVVRAPTDPRSGVDVPKHQRKLNPWSEFQKAHKGKGWSNDKMRAEYFKVKKL